MTQGSGFVLIFQNRKQGIIWVKSHITSEYWNQGLEMQTCALSITPCILGFTTVSLSDGELLARRNPSPLIALFPALSPGSAHIRVLKMFIQWIIRMLFVDRTLSWVLWCAFKEGRNLDPDILRHLWANGNPFENNQFIYLYLRPSSFGCTGHNFTQVVQIK